MKTETVWLDVTREVCPDGESRTLLPGRSSPFTFVVQRPMVLTSGFPLRAVCFDRDGDPMPSDAWATLEGSAGFRLFPLDEPFHAFVGQHVRLVVESLAHVPVVVRVYLGCLVEARDVESN